MKIKLTWIDRNGTSEGTRIYRSETRFDHTNLPEPLATVGPGITEYIDSTAERGKSYFYRLGTFRGADEALSELRSVIALPYTGPGPQKVQAGDHELGFFGEVSSEELFDGQTLSEMVGLGSTGTLINSDAGWLKFADRGKILFIAKKPFISSISWEKLYSAGLVYGVDGPGPYPVGDPVNQFTVVRKDLDAFVVRLMTGANNNESEWNRLMYKVADQVVSGQLGFKFKTYNVTTDLYVGGSNLIRNWCQERSGSNRVMRGTSDSIASYGTESVTTLYRTGWRPVLEYYPDL